MGCVLSIAVMLYLKTAITQDLFNVKLRYLLSSLT